MAVQHVAHFEPGDVDADDLVVGVVDVGPHARGVDHELGVLLDVDGDDLPVRLDDLDERDAAVLGPALVDTDSALVRPKEDQNREFQIGLLRSLGPLCQKIVVEAGHQLHFSQAMDAGLRTWLEERLATPWSPPTTPRDVPADRFEAMRRTQAFQSPTQPDEGH